MIYFICFWILAYVQLDSIAVFQKINYNKIIINDTTSLQINNLFACVSNDAGCAAWTGLWWPWHEVKCIAEYLFTNEVTCRRIQICIRSIVTFDVSIQVSAIQNNRNEDQNLKRRPYHLLSEYFNFVNVWNGIITSHLNLNPNNATMNKRPQIIGNRTSASQKMRCSCALTRPCWMKNATQIQHFSMQIMSSEINIERKAYVMD